MNTRKKELLYKVIFFYKKTFNFLKVNLPIVLKYAKKCSNWHPSNWGKYALVNKGGVLSTTL